MRIGPSRRFAFSTFAAVLILAASAPAASPRFAPAVEKRLSAVFEEGRAAFFDALDAMAAKHPRWPELGPSDRLRLAEARKGIPLLYERVIAIGYQRQAPVYEGLIAANDETSWRRFRDMFLELSRDYATRFVGSLFRRDKGDLSFLPQNKGKSPLDIVLQTLGYNAKSDPPAISEKDKFANAIPADVRTQWAIEAVGAREAWKENRGGGVVVAVIDTGIDPYNALFKDRLAPGMGFLARTTPPWSDESPSTIDYGLHGTGVSSVLSAIAPDCRIMMVREGDGDTMNDPQYPAWLFELGAAGIFWAVNHGAGVISVSADLLATERPVIEAVRYAYEHNVPICTSAGNLPRAQFGFDPAGMIYPAFDQEALVIGGVEKTDHGFRPWMHSVPNVFVDVAAPSADVYVLTPVYLPEEKGGYFAGTSLAAPIAAGVVAMMRAAAPPSKELLSQPGAYVRLVTRALRETARLKDLALYEPSQVVGAGLIDAPAAIKRLRELMAR